MIKHTNRIFDRANQKSNCIILGLSIGYCLVTIGTNLIFLVNSHLDAPPILLSTPTAQVLN